MKITFEQLLKSQSDNNLIDIYNETLISLEAQKKYGDSPMVLESFQSRVTKIRAELDRRGNP